MPVHLCVAVSQTQLVWTSVDCVDSSSACGAKTPTLSDKTRPCYCLIPSHCGILCLHTRLAGRMGQSLYCHCSMTSKALLVAPIKRGIYWDLDYITAISRNLWTQHLKHYLLCTALVTLWLLFLPTKTPHKTSCTKWNKPYSLRKLKKNCRLTA